MTKRLRDLETSDSRIVISSASEKSLSFAVRNSRFPHMCRTPLRFPHLSFIPPVPYPPLRGTFPSRGRLAIRGEPALKRPSGIAPFRHPERSEMSYVRVRIPEQLRPDSKDLAPPRPRSTFRTHRTRSPSFANNQREPRHKGNAIKLRKSLAT